jgi:uncharacterized membrane protein
MGYGRYGGGYGSMMGGGGGFEIFLMALFTLLLIAGVALLIIWLIRASGTHSTAHNAGTSQASGMHPAEVGHHEAVSIAKKRLASGEITKDQYEEIIRALNS